MSAEKKECTTTMEGASIVGPIWYIGWLFTLAFAKLSFWQALLGLVIWPYYLGHSLTL